MLPLRIEFCEITFSVRFLFCQSYGVIRLKIFPLANFSDCIKRVRTTAYEHAGSWYKRCRRMRENTRLCQTATLGASKWKIKFREIFASRSAQRNRRMLSVGSFMWIVRVCSDRIREMRDEKSIGWNQGRIRGFNKREIGIDLCTDR